MIAKLLRYDLAPSTPYVMKNGTHIHINCVRTANANAEIGDSVYGGKTEMLTVEDDNEPTRSKGNEISSIITPASNDPPTDGGLLTANLGDEKSILN